MTLAEPLLTGGFAARSHGQRDRSKRLRRFVMTKDAKRLSNHGEAVSPGSQKPVLLNEVRQSLKELCSFIGLKTPAHSLRSFAVQLLTLSAIAQHRPSKPSAARCERSEYLG